MSSIKFDFQDLNFLVTGASSGIGKQIALDLAKSGARILAVARRESILDELKTLYPDNIFVAACDVCDKTEIKKSIDNFVNVNGVFNGFVHAAGIYEFSPLKVFEKSSFYNMMDISFWSGFDIVQILQKRKYSADGCSFVMFSSVAARKGEKGLLAYSATKAAVSSAVRSVAKEIANRNMRINTIMPGRVDTPMTEPYQNDEVNNLCLLGVGKTYDVSVPVLFLLSDGAKWITGTDFVVDGGYLAC